MTRLENIPYLEQEIKTDPTFAKNSKCEVYFLAASKKINPHVGLYDVYLMCPFGSLIGVDDSQIERILCFPKIMRMHAVVLDANGSMKRYFNEGPG